MGLNKVIAALCLVLLFVGCGKSGSSQLTPEQQHELDAAHQAAVASCERLLGRKLSAIEEQCIHDEFRDGRLTGELLPPLSETVRLRSEALSSTQPAAKVSGMSKYQYLACDGGPHMLLPAELSNRWKGASGIADVMNPKSDYGRACAATANAPFALISVGTGSAMVFANPPLSSWRRAADGEVEVFDLKGWTGTDLDSLIDRVTAALTPESFKDSGKVLELHEPDAYLLYAGDTPRGSAYGVYRVPLPAGRYRVLVANYEKNGEAVSVYRLSKSSGVP